MKVKLDRYFFLGMFVLASVIANQWVNFVRWHDPLEVLWFCDFIAIQLALGLILKNRSLITVSLVTTVPAQSVWIIDFFLEALGHGMGRTAELWMYGQAVFWLSVNLHAILIPISLYGAWKLGFAKKAYKYVLIYVASLLVTTFLFTSPVENRNCVFYGCDQRDPGQGYLSYFIVKSLLFWLVTMSFSFFIFRYFFKIKEKLSNGCSENQELAEKSTPR